MSSSKVREEHADVTFDIEVAIDQFLDDPARDSLEFPHLTTGRRKLARSFVEKHSELVCESLGLGLERRLHVFKKCSNTCPGVVSVEKDPNAARDCEARSVTRPPVSASAPAAGGWTPALSPIHERTLKARIASPGRSTAASGTELSTRNSSPERSRGDLQTVPDCPQIRNTFIHFGSAGADARAVQTMPHNMFSKYVRAEAAEEVKIGSTSMAIDSPPSAHHPGMEQFLPGVGIVVDGLVKCPAFNGLRGVVQSWDADGGRYNVLLASPASLGGQQLAKVKGGNLRLAADLPPPLYFPTLVLEDCSAPPAILPSLPPSPTWEGMCASWVLLP